MRTTNVRNLCVSHKFLRQEIRIGIRRRRSRRASPKRARFDSPGRVSPGSGANRACEAPTGRDSLIVVDDAIAVESRPVGASVALCGATQGFAALRPGLSNLAPSGLSLGTSALFFHSLSSYAPNILDIFSGRCPG